VTSECWRTNHGVIEGMKIASENEDFDIITVDRISPVSCIARQNEVKYWIVIWRVWTQIFEVDIVIDIETDYV
jgi:hypothetical protein